MSGELDIGPPASGRMLARRTLPDLMRKPVQHPAGRVCAREGCVTRLTRYNKGDYCYAHKPYTKPRVRGVPSDHEPKPRRRSGPRRCRLCANRYRWWKEFLGPSDPFLDEDDGLVHRPGTRAEKLCQQHNVTG